jgi:hypothetical protein
MNFFLLGGFSTVSVGNQLNIFRAQANRYGQDWRAIIILGDRVELKAAVQDAADIIGGSYNAGTQVMTTPNGAQLRFAVVCSYDSLHRAMAGREFTQIAWLHRPEGESGDHMRTFARSRLRSKNVPSGDWRYEYCRLL